MNYFGTADRFTPEILLQDWTLEKLRAIYLGFGCSLLDTPCLEFADILKKEGGVGEQLTFVFAVPGEDRQVLLKLDQTISLPRVVEQHGVRLPFSRHQVGKAFRRDKPGPGRFREFTQCDADIVGAPAGLADAETIAILDLGFCAVGLPETITFVNSRVILRGLYELTEHAFYPELEFIRAIDKVGPNGETDQMRRYLMSGHPEKDESGETSEALTATNNICSLVEELFSLQNQPVNDALLDFASRFPALDDEVALLARIVEWAITLGARAENIRFSPMLARGMDYYTGPVFESRLSLWPNKGSLAGGGRYDGMVEIKGTNVPATGASFGIDRIMEALKELKRVPQELNAPTADLLIATRTDWLPEPLRCARELRAAGLRVMVYPSPTDSLAKQSAYAARAGIPLIVFLGPDEQAQKTVTIRIVTSSDENKADLRDSATTKNFTVPRENAIGKILELLEEA